MENAVNHDQPVGCDAPTRKQKLELALKRNMARRKQAGTNKRAHTTPDSHTVRLSNE